MERRSRNPDTQLREIALEKSEDELLAPTEAVCLSAGQISNGESTAAPMFPERALTQLLEAESADGNCLNTARQTFLGLSKQVRRSAPENKKSGARGPAICQYTKYGEQIRSALNLIYHDGTA